jgi:hypothetical protein
LGMIAPIWERFPVKRKACVTSLYLQLSESYNRKGLIDELRALDARLLIFLRRVRCLTVCISEPWSRTWKTGFEKVEIGDDMVRLVENGKECEYIIARHKVQNMPFEEKRLGAKASEIILGFPIEGDWRPRRESQCAYAFLPIRDYGFEVSIYW